MAAGEPAFHLAEERRKGKKVYFPANPFSLICLPRSHANPFRSQLFVLNLDMWPYLTGRDWEIKFLTGGIAASYGIVVLYFFEEKKGECIYIG